MDSNIACRQRYIELIMQKKILPNQSLFFKIFYGVNGGVGGSYIDLTALATAAAILRKSRRSDYKTSVFVDGLSRKETDNFRRTLRSLHIKTRKIRGVKRDENDALIRLADALCGLVRDAEDGEHWARDSMKQMVAVGVAREIE